MAFGTPEGGALAFLKIYRLRADSEPQNTTNNKHHLLPRNALPGTFAIQLNEVWQQNPAFEPTLENHHRGSNLRTLRFRHGASRQIAHVVPHIIRVIMDGDNPCFGKIGGNGREMDA